MIAGTHVIGASLVALLVDRLVLERRLGSTPYSVPAARLSAGFGTALPVMISLVISLVASCALDTYVLRPLGAAYLFPLLFAAFIAVTALAGALLPGKLRSSETRNRMAGRTGATSFLIGFLVLVPIANAGLSVAQGALNALIAGAVYCAVILLYNGIREKIELSPDAQKPWSPVQEFIVASLIALVLTGVSGLTLFHP